MNSALPACVAVASDQPLVADVVAAALSGNGLRGSVLGWPGSPDSATKQGRSNQGTLINQGAKTPREIRLEVGLLISDFDRVARIRSAVELIVEVPASWVVLTEVPRGPLWGALLELGSVHVAASTTGLDEVTAICRAVADGQALISEPERITLIAGWWAALNEHQDVVARLATMTPRETEVLRLLYAGSPVRSIAKQLDVAEATVRTQVKRVLRKLEVRSQLAAVATFERVGKVEASRDSMDVVATTMWLGRHGAMRPVLAR